MGNLDNLYSAILSGNLKVAVESTQGAIDEGYEPLEIINDYMAIAMREIGNRFENGKAFVPELLMAARAMKGALDILKPQMTGSGSLGLGKVVIGTVKGDLHDIGKNLVASMLEGSGFEVINLGVDVSSDKFVAAVKEYHPQIVCLSALLTTTMDYMVTIVEALKKSGLRDQVKIMIGGAPVSEAFARQIGADGYSENANNAVALARSLVL